MIFREGGFRGLWKGWVPNVQRAALVNLGGLFNDYLLPLACSRGAVVSHCTAVCMACLAARPPEVRSSTLGYVSLSVHAGQLSAYSEINISGKHRGFCDVLFNL